MAKPAIRKPKKKANPLKAAKMAAERGVRVHTIGFGSTGGGLADPAQA